jgi:ketosteroid isomerase-like protein
MQGRGTATTKMGKPHNNTYCLVWCLVNGKVQEMTLNLSGFVAA